MVPCPSCKSPIGLTLDFIIKNPISKCPNCGVVMKFKGDEKILEEYNNVINEIKNIKKQYQGAIFGHQKNKVN
jgi:uncharacterized Zn finger protein